MIPASERGELEAFRSLLAGQPQEEIGGALCTSLEATPNSAMFNRALGVGLASPATEKDLDQIELFFRERGLAYGVPLAPGAQPEELPEQLAARDFRSSGAAVRRAHSSPPGSRPGSPRAARRS